MIKLTQAQKDVIRKMRETGLSLNLNLQPGIHYWTIGQSISVKKETANSLKKKGIVENKMGCYFLTGLGRTINID